MNSPIQIAWVFGGIVRQTDSLVMEVPAAFDSELNLRGVLEITPGGSISAYFEQTNSIE